MHESGCGDKPNGQAILAGCQPKAEGNMRLAGSAVSNGDIFLVLSDGITARQLYHQYLVQRGAPPKLPSL